MPEAAGVTFDRDAWLVLAAALPGHPLVAPLEAQRLAAEFSAEERAAYAAAGEGFGWLCGSDAIGWFPRYPGRHTRSAPDGSAVVVDPPRRSLGLDQRGDPVEVIVTEPVPAAGVRGLLRRGVIRELEPMGDGVFGALASLNPADFPWRLGLPEEGQSLAGAWLLDAAGGRIAWVPRVTDARWIVMDVNAAHVAAADIYRLDALRDALDRLRRVTHKDDRYQPPPELTHLHEEAEAAVSRLLAALPAWAFEGTRKPAPVAPPPSAAPPPPEAAAPVPVPPPPAAPGRSGWLLALVAGLVLGWLAHAAR